MQLYPFTTTHIQTQKRPDSRKLAGFSPEDDEYVKVMDAGEEGRFAEEGKWKWVKKSKARNWLSKRKTYSSNCAGYAFGGAIILLLEQTRDTLHSLQDRKMQCWKDLGKWARDSERDRNEIEVKHAQLEELGQTIQKTSMAEVELDEEHRSLQARDDRRGSCASQSDGCCLDPAVGSSFRFSKNT